MNTMNRPLRERERALLSILLSADFPGCEELRVQAAVASVAGECECGCGTIDPSEPPGSPTAKVEPHIPIEAYGHALEVLLFAPGDRILAQTN